MIVPRTLTGRPESSVGEKRACRAAASAAGRNSGWPLTAFAVNTLPPSSMTTDTTTVPEARTDFAIEGYGGAGLLMALPLSTPPLTPPPAPALVAPEDGVTVAPRRHPLVLDPRFRGRVYDADDSPPSRFEGAHERHPGSRSIVRSSFRLPVPSTDTVNAACLCRRRHLKFPTGKPVSLISPSPSATALLRLNSFSANW